jgi:translation elongation factor EF-Tu-like GTPase
MDDEELLELIELELRELFKENNLPGDDLVIWHYPKDDNKLIRYLRQ